MLCAEYTLEFVKRNGSADAGNQVLSYAGNSFRVTTDVDTPTFSYNGGNYQSGIATKRTTGTVVSPQYSNKRNTTCANYYKYKNGSSMDPHYNVPTYKKELVSGGTKTIPVPTPGYGF